MPNAYYSLQGGREGGQKSKKPAYVIHGCSLSNFIFRVFSLQLLALGKFGKNNKQIVHMLKKLEFIHIMEKSKIQ